MEQRRKDPERVRLGRLGALTVHARGHTNVAPARAAWEQALAAEFGIGDELTPAEREKRLRAAMRVRMSRLARTRWGKSKGGSARPGRSGLGGVTAPVPTDPRSPEVPRDAAAPRSSTD